MKVGKVKVTLLTVTFILIIGAYIAGFFVYMEYRHKSAYFARQSQFTMDKFRELEEGLKKLHIALEDTIYENKTGRKLALSNIENIKDDIKNWKKEDRITLSELRDTIEGLKVDNLKRMVERLQANIEDFKLALQDFRFKQDLEGVDLGKISIEKSTRKPVQKPVRKRKRKRRISAPRNRQDTHK